MTAGWSRPFFALLLALGCAFSSTLAQSPAPSVSATNTATNTAAGTNRTAALAPVTNGLKSNIGVLVPVGPQPTTPNAFSGDLRRVKAEWQKRLTLGAGDSVSFST